MNEIIFHLNYVKGFGFQVNRLKKKCLNYSQICNIAWGLVYRSWAIWLGWLKLSQQEEAYQKKRSTFFKA